MYSFRKAYEPISTILDPVSSPVVARDMLQRVTFIFLAVNAGVGFALIMAALCTVSSHSKSLMACSIVYVVLFLMTIFAGVFLSIRVGYFKSHPLPGTPVPGQSSTSNDDNQVDYQQLNAPGNLENTAQNSEFQDVELGDIGAQHYQGPSSYHAAEYNTPYDQNPYKRAEEGNMTEEPYYPMPQGYSPSEYTRSSFEHSPRESFEINGNLQGTTTPRPSDRRVPFSPSVAQLSSWELGDRRKSYETFDEARADLRANWMRENGNHSTSSFHG